MELPKLATLAGQALVHEASRSSRPSRLLCDRCADAVAVDRVSSHQSRITNHQSPITPSLLSRRLVLQRPLAEIIADVAQEYLDAARVSARGGARVVRRDEHVGQAPQR